jgi:hypothetical protein
MCRVKSDGAVPFEARGLVNFKYSHEGRRRIDRLLGIVKPQDTARMHLVHLTIP